MFKICQMINMSSTFFEFKPLFLERIALPIAIGNRR